jgi:hypothetical protein
MKRKSRLPSVSFRGRQVLQHTWWLVGVVFWEVHPSLEVSTVVQGVWVDDDQGDGPVVQIFIIAELCNRQQATRGHILARMTDFDLYPFLFG